LIASNSWWAPSGSPARQVIRARLTRPPDVPQPELLTAPP
jgi:hypothetical protein